MKFIFLALIGIKLMAQQIVPYPYPNYDSDLIAKEIVNGTYMASINMMIKNSQTGEERYVHVPDSPDIIEKMERGEQTKEVYEHNVSDTPIYNRDKMLEDAVLPKYVDIEESLPIVVSYAQTPQNLEYAGDVSGNFGLSGNILGNLAFTARFDDGRNKFFVGVETTDNKDTATNGDDIKTFFKIQGTTKTKMFDADSSKLYVNWLYSVGGRNFFKASGAIYEYTASGSYTKLQTTEDSFINFPFILRDGKKFYSVSVLGGKLSVKNVDSGEILSVDTDYTTNGKYTVSAYKDSMFYSLGIFVEVRDNRVLIREDYKPWEHSNIKVRFEYLDNNLVTKFNIKHGNPKFPMSKRPSSRQESFLGLKEGYISIQNNVLFYTKDYQKYISSGISVSSSAKIAICEDYIYLYETGRVVVVAVDGWSTKIPSDRYAELYAKNKMLDSQNYRPRIGD